MRVPLEGEKQYGTDRKRTDGSNSPPVFCRDVQRSTEPYRLALDTASESASRPNRAPRSHRSHQAGGKLAEGEGFEPPVPLRVRLISRRVAKPHCSCPCAKSGVFWAHRRRCDIHFANGATTGAGLLHLQKEVHEVRRFFDFELDSPFLGAVSRDVEPPTFR